MGMMINPTKRSREHALFESLQRAHRSNLVVVSVKNTDRLNRPGSPVWEPGENVVPLLAMLLIALVCNFAVNLAAGTAMMVFSVLAYISVIRPWILRRVHRRAFDTAMKNVQSWDNLWAKGGLMISVAGASGARCMSPVDNWRAFISHHFPQPKLVGADLYQAFKSTDEDTANVKTIPVLSS